MVALKYIPLLALLTLLAFVFSGRNARAVDGHKSTLFAQSAAEELERDFSKTDISFLLLDFKSGQVLASNWDHADKPIPLGSLVKPFTALAYGEQHNFKYPVHVCRGSATGCWLARGHGKVNLTKAIAYSCNSYFQVLSNHVSVEQVSLTAARFGIEAPQSGAANRGLAGIGKQWMISPMKIARAYLELAQRRDQPGVREIIDGMALSGRLGTGAAVDAALKYEDALTKTGTAPCMHAKHAPGDGFAIALAPAQQPHILLLVCVHGVPGAQAAKTAGEMLRRIGE